MLAPLGRGGTGSCSKFLKYWLYPIRSAPCCYLSVLPELCKSCPSQLVPLLFFCLFLSALLGVSSEGWKGGDNTHELYTSYAQTSLLSLEPYSTKRTAQHILKEDEEITNKHGSWGNRALNVYAGTVCTGTTLTHKYFCSASWEPLFPSVRDEIISTWKHVKVMSISSQQQNIREDLSKHTKLYHESLSQHLVSFFWVLYYNMQK